MLCIVYKARDCVPMDDATMCCMIAGRKVSFSAPLDETLGRAVTEMLNVHACLQLLY